MRDLSAGGDVHRARYTGATLDQTMCRRYTHTHCAIVQQMWRSHVRLSRVSLLDTAHTSQPPAGALSSAPRPYAGFEASQTDAFEPSTKDRESIYYTSTHNPLKHNSIFSSILPSHMQKRREKRSTDWSLTSRRASVIGYSCLCQTPNTVSEK